MTRHGKTVWYVRLEKRGPRIRLKAEFGSPEFWEEYNAALSGMSRTSKKAAAGTLAWLVELYRQTSAWSDLSLATRRQRDNILRHVTAPKSSACSALKAASLAHSSRNPRVRWYAHNLLYCCSGKGESISN